MDEKQVSPQNEPGSPAPSAEQVDARRLGADFDPLVPGSDDAESVDSSGEQDGGDSRERE